MKNARQYWSKHIAAIELQGIGTGAYAKQHGLALASLYYWQRRLRSDRVTFAAMGPTPRQRQSGKFIALTVNDPIHPVARSENACALVLGGGLRLEMSALPDPQWLAALGRCTHGAH